MLTPEELARNTELEAGEASASRGGVGIAVRPGGNATGARAGDAKATEDSRSLVPPPSGSRPAAGNDVQRLVSTLERSPRSFKYLRTIGFNLTDADFETIVVSHPNLFRPTRIVRRDENGNRIIPGWPGVRLNAAAPKR